MPSFIGPVSPTTTSPPPPLRRRPGYSTFSRRSVICPAYSPVRRKHRAASPHRLRPLPQSTAPPCISRRFSYSPTRRERAWAVRCSRLCLKRQIVRDAFAWIGKPTAAILLLKSCTLGSAPSLSKRYLTGSQERTSTPFAPNSTHAAGDWHLAKSRFLVYPALHGRSVAQPGRALSSGGRGREFESRHSDHIRNSGCIPLRINLHASYRARPNRLCYVSAIQRDCAIFIASTR